jgi:hypothetical protein
MTGIGPLHSSRQDGFGEEDYLFPVPIGRPGVRFLQTWGSADSLGILDRRR